MYQTSTPLFRISSSFFFQQTFQFYFYSKHIRSYAVKIRSRLETTQQRPSSPQGSFEATVPVRLPPRKPFDVLIRSSRASSVLLHPALSVGRQMEMLNVLMGMF
jgi:hypothetical protein